MFYWGHLLRQNKESQNFSVAKTISGHVQRRADKDAKTLEKFILHKNCWQWLRMCIVEHLYVLEHSRTFISNPENEILFQNNLLETKWTHHAKV